MKKVVISGATGFIGKWLIREMLKNKIEVTAIIRDMARMDEKYGADIHVIEASDYDKVELRPDEYDVFYHLAWSGVDASDKNRIDLQLLNIQMAISAMKLAKRCGCKKFIATGTVAEYTMCDSVMNVSNRQTPSDFYGAVKVAVFYMLEVLSKQIDIPFIWAQLPSTFGEGRNDDNIIVYTIKELLAGKKPLFGPLDQMWDFLYVSEVAKALRLLGEFGIPGKTYGIGSGEYSCLKNYILRIRDMIDPQMELGIGELPVFGQRVMSSCVGIYDLVKDTGFKVQVGFEEGMRRTIDYYKKLEDDK